MQISDFYELILKLKSFGLTEYEARVYLSLLYRTELTAEDVSSLSEVPLPRVYDVLEELEKKGFVEIISGRPRRFEAIEPRSAFNNYLDYLKRSLNDQISKMEKDFSSLQPTLEEHYYKSRLRIDPSSLLEPLSDLHEMEDKTREMISSAKKEVLIFSQLFTWFNRLEKDIKAALNRGVEVRILMRTSTSESKSIFTSLQRMGVKVRVSSEDWYPVRGTIVDKCRLIFLIWVPREERLYWSPIVYRPHYTENRGLISIFLDAFERRWSSAYTS
ncbi:MAG: helix-turn-helix domain-containing protein [Candidatus Methanomethylicia archaeon]